MSCFGGEVRHLYLTWKDDPCHDIVVNIHGLSTPDEITLYYDTTSHENVADYRFSVKGKGSKVYRIPDERLLYHLTLKDLLPGATYTFTLDGKTEWKFCTLPHNCPWRFIEGGDWEIALAGEELAKQAATFHPHAILLGGDYPSHVFGWRDYKKWDEWLDVYTRTMVTSEGHLIPLVLAIGNHDLCGGHAPFYFHYFHQGNTGKSYFSVPLSTHGRLFILDSGHVEKQGGEQVKWLEKELQLAQEPIKMALYHVPLYPSVRFFEKEASYRIVYGVVKKFFPEFTEKLYSKESSEGRKHWLPLFDAYHLTCAFEHHDQTLKRTKLLKGDLEDPLGTLYLGDGCFAPKQQFIPLQGYVQPYFAMLQGKKQFFWLVEIEKERITYQAVTKRGEVIDHFVQNVQEREQLQLQR